MHCHCRLDVHHWCQGQLSPTPRPRTPLADITSQTQGSITPRIPPAELDSSQLSQRLFHSPSPSMCQTSSPSNLLLTQVPVSANQSGVSHAPAANHIRERRHQLNTERQLVEIRQQVEQLGTMMGKVFLKLTTLHYTTLVSDMKPVKRHITQCPALAWLMSSERA